MVRSFRRYRRGRTRRFRKLSKANIYGNRSARAQAGQIAALNRKVNKVIRRDKPEYKVLNAPPVAKSFTSNALDSAYFADFQPFPVVNNASDHGMVGNKVNLISLTMNGYCEYFNSSNTGYHDTESAGCVLRIIAVQYKQLIDNPITSIADILQETGSTGTGYTALAYSPFKLGITTRLRVLMDYKTTLTTTRNQKLLKIKVPIGKFRDLRYNESLQTWENAIQFFIVVGGLHYDQNYTETLQFNAMLKVVYTDN